MVKRVVKLSKKTQNVKVRQLTNRVVIKQVGAKGEPGIPGPSGADGLGIPAGGAEGDILYKDSTTDFDAKWAQPISFSDKNFVADFIVASTVAVNHNLNKYPAVNVMNSAGEEVEGEVDYLNTNQLIVYFAAPFSGRITCN